MGMQVEMALQVPVGHGGRREGAGRKRQTKELPHGPRPYHDKNHPTHVTLRVVRGLPSLRKRELARVIGETVRKSSEREQEARSSFGVTHFSIQPDHMHLIVEAGNKTVLTRGLRGLAVWMARRLNKVLGRSGRVIADRYHAHDLASPTEVRRAIVYVLQNHLHHEPSPYLVDENSSARWSNDYEAPLPVPDTPSPVRDPQTWLLRQGYRRAGGPIRFNERPKN